jgi:hypothetical protein
MHAIAHRVADLQSQHRLPQMRRDGHAPSKDEPQYSHKRRESRLSSHRGTNDPAKMFSSSFSAPRDLG